MMVETFCSYCLHTFSRMRSSRAGGRRARYCSHRCRQAAYRVRHSSPARDVSPSDRQVAVACGAIHLVRVDYI
jgi:hypothetical protein